jgi:hypothetical protein
VKTALAYHVLHEMRRLVGDDELFEDNALELLIEGFAPLEQGCWNHVIEAAVRASWKR